MAASIVFQRRLNTSFISILFFLLCSTTARRIPYAGAVFPGFGGGNKGGSKQEQKTIRSKDTSQQEKRNTQNLKQNSKLPPPPPPPPDPNEIPAGSSDERENDITGTQGYENVDSREYPPQPQYWEEGPFNQYGNIPPPPPGWIGPPPPDWNHQSGVVQQELEQWAAHEGYLLTEIKNLTAIISNLQQQEDLHLRQLNALTERVMDAESDAATERNSLAEYRANYTELSNALASMKEEIDSLKEECRILNTKHIEDEEKLDKMKIKLKERSREVEELATVIEMARVEHDREQYLAGRRKKKKQRGIFSWLFGIGEEKDEDSEEEERLQEFARTTLLRALQTERDSVHELETSLATLEQNNSAISEMVESRDMLIDELNNRVAVFEEDKIVLKAALRQLQKEMKEETPKTQKLVDNLTDARQEIQSLNRMIDSVLSDHQTEVALLQNVITQKQKAINATESNMTVIGTYVDRLEERLANFAITKREIEIREKKCAEIETCIVKVEGENEGQKVKITEFQAEHNEIKGLLKELTDERTQLHSDKLDMTKEKDGLISEGSTLRDTISSLEVDVDSLNIVVSEWKLQVAERESRIDKQISQLEASKDREKELEVILEQKNVELEKERNRAPPVLEPRHSTKGNGNQANSNFVKPSVTCPLPSQREIGTNADPQTMLPEVQDQSDQPHITQSVSSSVLTEKYMEQAPPPPTQVTAGRSQCPQEERQPPQSMNTTATKPQIIQIKRTVPFRSIRKTFSKITGIHGAFTPSSRK